MSYVIKATLLGIIPEESEPVTVCFPIPDEQYDRTIDRLSQARMDHATGTVLPCPSFAKGTASQNKH